MIISLFHWWQIAARSNSISIAYFRKTFPSSRPPRYFATSSLIMVQTYIIYNDSPDESKKHTSLPLALLLTQRVAKILVGNQMCVSLSCFQRWCHNKSPKETLLTIIFSLNVRCWPILSRYIRTYTYIMNGERKIFWILLVNCRFFNEKKKEILLPYFNEFCKMAYRKGMSLKKGFATKQILIVAVCLSIWVFI